MGFFEKKIIKIQICELKETKNYQLMIFSKGLSIIFKILLINLSKQIKP